MTGGTSGSQARWAQAAPAAWLLGLALGLAAPAAGQVEVSPRDSWQRVDEIFAALDVQPGDRIADIGAGSGFLSFRLSRAVGETGRVLAVDIDRRSLRRLWGDARRAGLLNIDTIVSEPDDPMLAPASVDGVVIVNAYHEMRAYEAMLAGIYRALRPGGRLVIVDNAPTDAGQSRQRQAARHDIALALVAQDLDAAGFTVLAEYPAFINESAAGRERDQWLLVAVPRP